MESDPAHYSEPCVETDSDGNSVQLIYLGQSGNQQFLMRVRESDEYTTRTVIIDGVVPPQVPLGPDIATESQLAIDGVFTRCAEDAVCNDRFPDVHST